MSYEGGFTSALNSAANRSSQEAQRQAMMQALVQNAMAFQQEQAQRQRANQARSRLGEMLPQLLGAPPAAGGPQPPPPGVSSVPPPGQMPPPPAAAAPPGGGAATMPQGAGPGAPMPKPKIGPPGDAGASMPTEGWKPLPTPPGTAAPAGEGIPPPPEDAVMPRQAMSVADLTKILGSKGIKGQDALDMIDQWKPYMDSQNKAELDALKVKSTAQAAAMKAYQGVIAAAERERHNRVTETQGAKRVEQGARRLDAKAAEKAGEGDLEKDSELRGFLAQQYWAGDSSVFTNLGRGAQGAKNILALRKEVEREGKRQGKSAKDLAAAVAEFQGMKAGERTLGTRTANVEMAVQEAQNMASVVIDTSAKFPRTQYTPINKALKAFQDNTGSTETRQFGAAVNSFINAYSRAISPSGVPTVHDKEHAREMLSTADSHEQVQAVMKTLQAEMSAAQKAPRQVKDSMRNDFTGGGGRSQLGPPKKGDVVNGYEYQGGDYNDSKSWRKAP